MKVTSVALFVMLLLLPALAKADTFGSGANTFDIEFVPIGNPGNAGDSQVMICCSESTGTSGYGSVPYSYRMGKFEISEQMIGKANALGGLGITLGARGPNKPADRVGWNEAARFVNWLNTSIGSTPAYKFAIQPGEADYVATTNIELWTISDAGYNPNNVYRNSLATYFLPSVDEWYKAAYYDPTSGVYYDYPTGSDIEPESVAGGTAAGTAVWGGYPSPADITLAGGLSPYGTMGQGGNAWEFEETDRDLVNGPSSDNRGVRAGSWGDQTSNYMRASDRNGFGSIMNGTSHYGFRVASIAALGGDFDLDGDVDGRDFLAWQRNPSVGDLADWQTYFGADGLGAESIAVPEPSTAMIACASLLCLAVRMRHRE